MGVYAEGRSLGGRGRLGRELTARCIDGVVEVTAGSRRKSRWLSGNVWPS